MDHTVHGIFQARILEWVAFPFSRGYYQPLDRTQVSRIAGASFTTESPGKPKLREALTKKSWSPWREGESGGGVCPGAGDRSQRSMLLGVLGQ